MNRTRKFYNTLEAAHLLGLQRSGVAAAIKRGALKAEKFGVEWLIWEEDIIHYRKHVLGKNGPKSIPRNS